MKPNPNHRGDPLFLPELFRHFGIKHRALPNWNLWGMGDFWIIQGLVVHHTGARTTTAEYIARNPGLGNALSSQIHTDPTGLQTLCGAGIAWHAGRGSHPGWPTNDANRVSIGIEMQHNGTDPWPAAQLDSTYRMCAVILWYLGKTATTQTLLSHWEYSMRAQGKWDPGAGNGRSGEVMNMVDFRNRVNQYINNINRYGALDAPVKKGAFMSLSDAEQREVLELVRSIKGQLTGDTRVGEYPGWPQLGGKTLVDAVAVVMKKIGVK